MKHFARLLLTSLWLTLPTSALAQEAWVVGVKEAPPFVMRSDDGGWTGLSVELWQRIAADMQITYEFQEYDLAGLLKAVEDSEIDVAVAALTVTPERERVLDFTHGYSSRWLGYRGELPRTNLNGSLFWRSSFRPIFSL